MPLPRQQSSFISTAHSTRSKRARVFLALPVTLAFAAVTPLHAQWTPTWGDDFNGPAGASYDTSKWFNEVKQNTGNVWGDGTIQSTTDSRANSYLDGNGNLIVALTYDASTGNYYSARLTTAGKYDVGPYGQIEARLITPGAPGTGAAFWSLGADLQNQNVPWPWAGELDIMENQAKTGGHNGSTLHGGQTDGGTFYEYGGVSEPVDLPNGQLFSSAFHTFTVQWKPYHLYYLLDGVQYGDVDLASIGATDQWPVEQALDLILSSGAGGNGGTPDTSKFPANMTVDYVHYSKWSAGAPAPVTGLKATATNSNAVSLSWNASSTSGVTYDIYASTTPNTPTSLSDLVAQGVTGTSYNHLGLQPGTNYYYTVNAANFGGESSASSASAQTQAPGNSTGILLSAGGYASGNYMASNFVLGGSTNFRLHAPIDTSLVTNPAPQEVYDTERFGAAAWTITGLTPGAVYQVRAHFIEGAHTGTGQRAFNVSINSQTVLNNYDIYQDAQATNRVVVKSFNTRADEYGIIELQTSAGTNSVPDLNPTISAIDVLPGSDTSNLVGAKPGTATSLSINSGGVAVNNFVADTDFNGGDVATSTATIDTSAANAAPAAVYQSQRYVPFTYVLTGLAAGATYDVRMHFAETYTGITGNGQRIFNVNINNQPALANFDIYQAAGGINKAVVRDYSTKADMYGQIIAQFIYGGVQQPQINGIEALQTAGAVAPPAAPGAPSGLSGIEEPAGGGNPTNYVALTWNASSTAGATYTIYRGTGSGTPVSIVSGVSNTYYNDTTGAASTTYSYYVVANNGTAASSPSNTVSVTTFAAQVAPATNLTATASGSQINLGWTASTSSGVTYSVYRGNGFSAASAIATGLTGTSYADTTVAAGTSYTYDVVTTSSSGAVSPISNQVTVTAGTISSPSAPLVAINAGGSATSGYAADEYFTGGGTYSNTGTTVATAGVANAAPAAVYGSEHEGVFTYTIPGLTAGTSYGVQLHFAELYFSQKGQRQFNVSINGKQVLTNFDVVATAGGNFKAVVEPFTATANASGQIVISFTAGAADQPAVNAIAITGATAAAPASAAVALNAGGAAGNGFAADADFSGGGTYSNTSQAVSVAGVANAAPAAIYQSERQGVFTYTIPGFAAGSTHTVRLHFAELYFSQKGQRQFNVAINGQTVLPNFDIVGAAGSNFKAVVEPFTATANANGAFVISFTTGAHDQPTVNGIEVQ